MPLVERERELAALDDAFADAADGRGGLVLVAGEAGIGKSVLVRAFVDRHRPDAEIWWGACDDLDTPRPLGPFADIAADVGILRTVFDGDAPTTERFQAVIRALRGATRPVIVVLEDVHWADAATRDALVYLARRLPGLAALVVATHRVESPVADDPLRATLGAIATAPGVRRVHVGALSPAAVVELVQGMHDPQMLYELTGGNPFFVTEAVHAAAAGLDGVPPTVADAVLARAAGLAPVARTALDAAAIVPESVELRLLRSLLPGGEGIDECVRRGLLTVDGDRVRFRHELARRAIEEALPPVRRQDLHAAVLRELVVAEADPARLAHHAAGAGDRAAELRFALLAGDQASRLGARREAARHLQRALALADALEPDARAELLERFADECAILGRAAEASAARGEALAIWRSRGADARVALNLARSATALPAAERIGRIREAVAIAEPLGATPALAYATAQLSYALMLARDVHGALEQGERAVRLAEQVGDATALSRALNAVGSAMWFVDPDRAEAPLRRAMEVAAAAGDLDRYADAMVNLGSAAGEVRRYDTAERWLLELVDWSTTRDIDALRDYALAWLARVEFERGRWRAAEARLTELGETPDLISRLVADAVRVRLAIRRGNGIDGDLADLLELAGRTGDLQRLWPAVGAAAEAAWLAGDIDRIPELVRPTYELALRLEQPWARGELAGWLRRAGIPHSPDGVATPYRLEREGRWRDAASEWEAVGCPYERAMALAELDDPDALTQALDILGRLGARPLGDRVAARLREHGVRRLPRRPSRRTLDHAALLTDRELDVLRAIAGGGTNAEIARSLHLSVKTVGHHVSAILQKLQVDGRRDAVRRGRELGLVD